MHIGTMEIMYFCAIEVLIMLISLVIDIKAYRKKILEIKLKDTSLLKRASSVEREVFIKNYKPKYQIYSRRRAIKKVNSIFVIDGLIKDVAVEVIDGDYCSTTKITHKFQLNDGTALTGIDYTGDFELVETLKKGTEITVYFEKTEKHGYVYAMYYLKQTKKGDKNVKYN